MINTSAHFYLIYTAIILFGGFFFTSCNSDSKNIPRYNNEIDLTKDVAYDVVIIISQKAKAQTRIKAPLLVRNEKIIPAFAEMPEGLYAEFFNDSGIVSTHLTAEFARYYEREQNVILQKNVVVVNADSTILKTEELVWNNKLEKFFSDTAVHIDRQGHIITGTGLEANKELTEIKIFQQRSLIPVEDSLSPASQQPGTGLQQVDSSRKQRPGLQINI